MEKCSRMKETMKMMGLSNWILWSSWVISRALIMLLTVSPSLFIEGICVKLSKRARVVVEQCIETNDLISYLSGVDCAVYYQDRQCVP